MNDHPISSLMTETMAKIKEMVDVDTIIGTPITTCLLYTSDAADE